MSFKELKSSKVLFLTGLVFLLFSLASCTGGGGGDGVSPLALISSAETTPPWMVYVSISSPAVAAGDSVILNFIVCEKLSAPPAVTILGRSAAVVNTSGSAYTATMQVQPSDPAGPVSFIIGPYTDMAGNNGEYVSSTTDQSVSSVSAQASDTVLAPVFSIPGDEYASSQKVYLYSSTSDATIMYTTDGSVPSATNGTKFDGASPIKVNSKSDIKAIAIKTGLKDSQVAGASMTIAMMQASTAPNQTIKLTLPGGVKLEMVKISAKGKSFMMGDKDLANPLSYYHYASPVHKVTFNKDFYIGKYEVTQKQWLNSYGSWSGKDNWRGFNGDNFPVYNISWNDLTKSTGFLSKLNKLAPGGYSGFRLPTEAEWEFACRAGTTTVYYWGDNASDGPKYSNSDYAAGYWNDSQYLSPVGTLLPNAFGLYDMNGNIEEWCQDNWHDNYNFAPTDGSAWVPGSGKHGTDRILRGDSYEGLLRPSADRAHVYESFDCNFVGFRLVMDVPFAGQ